MGLKYVYSPPLRPRTAEPRLEERTAVGTLRTTAGRGGPETVHLATVAFDFSLSYVLGIQVMINLLR